MLPYIPEMITVHLGSPNNNNVDNVTVTFPDYIKNVASSEIYPTWPGSALRANILAQISFALNRVYTEYYRSRGYYFDITNDTSVDQSFINGRNFFDSVSVIVDDIFNNYIRRSGDVEPLFAQYCNGTTTICDGMSQWGSLSLAEQGQNSLQILQFYYGDDIEIVTNAEIRGISESYPGTPLSSGSNGDDVRLIQNRLNRVSTNYPSIPKINPVNGVFSLNTQNAVLEFQRIFNLTVDGVVGKSTWYKLQYIYAAVKRLNELTSEGLSYDDIAKQYPEYLSEGMSSDAVALIQYFLTFIAQYEATIEPIIIDGSYGRETTEAVKSFQRTYQLDVDGIVGEQTYNVMYDVYVGMIDALPNDMFENVARPFPGNYIPYGEVSESVFYLQTYLEFVSRFYPSMPSVTPDGIFGEQTLKAVQEFERLVGLPGTTYVNVVVWNKIAELYDDLRAGIFVNSNQYPGFVIDGEVS